MCEEWSSGKSGFVQGLGKQVGLEREEKAEADVLHNAAETSCVCFSVH